MPAHPNTDALRRRNALWQRLRQAEPGSADFEDLLRQLSVLTHWSRERLLAGLGLTDPEPSGPASPEAG